MMPLLLSLGFLVAVLAYFRLARLRARRLHAYILELYLLVGRNASKGLGPEDLQAIRTRLEVVLTMLAREGGLGCHRY